MKKYRVLFALGIFGLLAAAKIISTSPPPSPPAPSPPKPKGVTEFPKGLKWFNSAPLRMADLKGRKAVLLQFWRFECPYSVRVVPRIVNLHHQFKDKGLVVVGIHTPSTGSQNERNPRLVQKAIQDLKIDYPVVLDSDADLLNKYSVQGFPTFFVIDRAGKIERVVESSTETTIRSLTDGIQKVCGDLKSSPPPAAQ